MAPPAGLRPTGTPLHTCRNARPFTWVPHLKNRLFQSLIPYEPPHMHMASSAEPALLPFPACLHERILITSISSPLLAFVLFHPAPYLLSPLL